MPRAKRPRPRAVESRGYHHYQQPSKEGQMLSDAERHRILDELGGRKFVLIYQREIPGSGGALEDEMITNMMDPALLLLALVRVANIAAEAAGLTEFDTEDERPS